MRSRLATLLSTLVFLVATTAFAGEKGLVSNSGGMLKMEPKPKGKKVDKLKQGIMVDVVDHSADGLWVKVIATGPNGNLEGWVEKSYVRSLSRYGFSWERKSATGGNPTVGKPAPIEKPADPPETTTTDPIPTTEEDGGWGNETPIDDPSASEWGNETPAEATPAPGVDATPTPAEDEGWGTETDLTQ